MNIRTYCGAIVALLLFFSGVGFGHEGAASVKRQYPIPNAVEVPPVTNIGITASAAFDPSVLGEGVAIGASGTRTGSHNVTLRLSDDHETLILHPTTPFAYDERVTVSIAGAKLVDGKQLTTVFQFRTMVKQVSSDVLRRMMNESAYAPAVDTEGLADTLPPMQVLVDNRPTPGTIYLSNFGLGMVPNNNFLLTLDEHGNVLRQRNFRHRPQLDFKVQPTNTFTYFDDEHWAFFALDSDWNVIDTFRSANGYPADQHELRIFPDGGYALIAESSTTLDSSQYVAGMVPGASIGGNVIQIFDAHGNETFEWRGIDHYRVADAIHQKLSDSSIDFEHANSLEFDSAGNIILSNRHLSEITKIDRATGKMLWRLGGAHNQFTLVNDSVWFSYQHNPRLLPNGHLTVFDNSNYDSVTGVPGYIHHSRALEYALDTSAKTATCVWQWHHTPETFSVAMGSVERLPNGNTLIGWGLNFNYAATEVDRRDSTVFELSLGPNNVSYRVFKDPVPDSLLSNVAVTPIRSGLAITVSREASRLILNVPMEHAEAVSVAVLDVLGRTVFPSSSSFAAEGVAHIPLDIQSLAPGKYFCTLRSASGRSAACAFVVAK